MSRIFSVLINIIAATVALSLTACGGGGGSDSIGTGTLSLGITDAPVKNEDIDEVWVRFTQVTIHPSDGSPDIVVDVVNDDGKPWRDIDLKSLTNGKTMLLGEIELAAGHYSWIRQKTLISMKQESAKVTRVILPCWIVPVATRVTSN